MRRPAVELLTHAVKAGYKDHACKMHDTYVEPVHVRDDFKKLLAELKTTYPTPRDVAPMPREKQ